MKKILTVFVFAMFVLSLGLVVAANGAQAQDTTGPMHDEIIAAGGQGGVIVPGEGMMFAAREGTYRNAENKEMKIERVENKYQIKSGEQYANCSDECNLTQEQVQNQTRLYAQLSNGKNAEIKVMPDTASETALQRLRLNVCDEEKGCTIELKEVGSGDETTFAYEMKTERRAKFLGFIGTNMNVEAQVDAETGEVIKTRKPWWAFLASEPAEVLE